MRTEVLRATFRHRERRTFVWMAGDYNPRATLEASVDNGKVAVI